MLPEETSTTQIGTLMELYLPPIATGHSKSTGRFLKGHVPANKGKHWSEYMSKRAQRRAAKGWSNLEKYRPKTRPDLAGRCKKKVVAVTDDGFRIFDYSVDAATWCRGDRANVNRCCRLNAERHVNRKTGKVNTDHAYCGARFYFYDDPIMWEKIKQF